MFAQLQAESLAWFGAEDETPEGMQYPSYTAIFAYVRAANELPVESARPFAEWLYETWPEYENGEEQLTNAQVIQGALTYWRGQ